MGFELKIEFLLRIMSEFLFEVTYFDTHIVHEIRFSLGNAIL